MVAKICLHCFCATTHTAKHRCCECEEISAIYRQCIEIYRWRELYGLTPSVQLKESHTNDGSDHTCFNVFSPHITILWTPIVSQNAAGVIRAGPFPMAGIPLLVAGAMEACWNPFFEQKVGDSLWHGGYGISLCHKEISGASTLWQGNPCVHSYFQPPPVAGFIQVWSP